MPLAYRYHRFSSKAQDAGTSLQRQSERTQALCEKNGWETAETLEDKGQSAWKGDHLRVGNLGKFRARVDAGLIPHGSILVIENLDRLSRQDVRRARRWIEDLTETGIKVAVCNPEIVLDEEALSGSNIGSMVIYLLEAKRSSGESDRKSELQHGAVERFMEKARRGVVYSARAPSWLKGEKNGAFEIIEDRAAIVRQIYEWSADGFGFYTIARQLNESVEPWTKPHKASSPSWKPGYVRDILISPAVEGEYHRRTKHDRKTTVEIIYDYYPRIVSAELVQRARAAHQARSGNSGVRHTEARNLFAGVIKCGHCGDTMFRSVQGAHGRKYEYLKCIRANNGAGCENSTLYRYDHFERAALREILHLALDDTFFVRSDLTTPLMVRVAELEKELEALEARQKRLLSFVMEEDDADEAKDQLRALRPSVAAKRQELVDSQTALTKARGGASADEHLRRVMEVRDAIYSEDQVTREQARRRVREAIQGVVQVVSCRRVLPDPSARPVRRTPERQIIMALGAGEIGFMFDNEGRLVNSFNLNGSVDVHVGELANLKPLGETLARRMANAPA